MIKLFSKRLKNKKGFTLVELVVVIAILGILAAIAVPRLGGARDNAQEHADEATARTILSAVALVEAEGKDVDEDNVNEYLNDDIVKDNQTGENWNIERDSEGTWVVYKGSEQILPRK